MARPVVTDLYIPRDSTTIDPRVQAWTADLSNHLTDLTEFEKQLQVRPWPLHTSPP